MRKQQLVNLAAGAAFVMSGAASAIEIVDTENVPAGYAVTYEAIEPKTGEAYPAVAFGGASTAWRPVSWNRILNGYGLELSHENGELAPKSFCKMVEKVTESGETEMVMVFNDKESIIYPPSRMNQILEAYGVTLDIEKIGEVPKRFARAVEQENEDGELETVAQFGGEHVVWTAKEFNNILAAYN